MLTVRRAERVTMTTSTLDPLTQQKPLPSEVDVFGRTDVGRVRQTNADHFLVASFYRAMRVHASSIPSELFTTHSTYSRGFVFLVADGVGSAAKSAEGSARAVQSVTHYLLDMSEAALQAQPAREMEVAERLKEAVLEAHQALIERGEDEPGGVGATTLTMLVALWPRLFIVHVGDSRCYRFRQGVLERMTEDQTMAQAMIESGVVKPDSPESNKWKHVLTSALGSSQVEAQIRVTDVRWNDTVLLCTDGLTKHVSEAEIQARLVDGGDAETLCHDLVNLALERGGEDNITVLIGRARNE
jgi:PPM family protein phosphatase